MTNIELFIEEFTTKAKEIYDLLDKYSLKDEVSLVLGAAHNDFEDDEEPKVQLSFIVNSPDIDDLEELLLFIQKAGEDQAGPEEGTIDWWIDRFGDGSVN